MTGGTIAINGGAAQALSPSNGLQAVSIPAGTSKFVLNLPAKITTGAYKAVIAITKLLIDPQLSSESRPHGSIAIHRGPLNYAFDSKSLIYHSSFMIHSPATVPRSQ